MNLKSIINDIEKADQEQVSDRRELLKSFGAKVAIAALPIAIGSLLFDKKAYGKTTQTELETLNFALTLAYFQYNFYHTANNTGGLIPSNPGNNTLGVNDKPGFIDIETNVKAHIVFLNTAITSLGGTPYTPKYYNASDLNPFYIPTAYDFTMGRTYEVFSQYPVFLMIAQVFQDTFVRGLKGQLPTVMGNTTLLTQLLQLHSVEARHASFIRTVRRYTGAAENPAPWITNDISPITVLQPTYNGENNVTQLGGFTIDTLPDSYDPTGVVPKASATAAFDEPMDVAFVWSFIGKFML